MVTPDSSSLTVWSPAKVNFFLEVLGKRPDGYHELITLMACITLADRITFRAVTGEITGETVAGPGYSAALPEWEHNLVFRALDLLRRESGVLRGMQVRLEKRIPQQAGLGGGSSNAASALLAANRLWGLNWSAQRLAELAARLGSDIPFFLGSGTSVCRGRGEIVQSLQGLAGIPLVIAQPPEGLSTPRVFAELDWDGERRDLQPALLAMQRRSASALADSLFNRLEIPAARLSGWPSILRAGFDRVACLGHQMSGSGSCWFGLFRNRKVAWRGLGMLRQRLPEVKFYMCETIAGRTQPMVSPQVLADADRS